MVVVVVMGNPYDKEADTEAEDHHLVAAEAHRETIADDTSRHHLRKAAAVAVEVDTVVVVAAAVESLEDILVDSRRRH